MLRSVPAAVLQISNAWLCNMDLCRITEKSAQAWYARQFPTGYKCTWKSKCLVNLLAFAPSLLATFSLFYFFSFKAAAEASERPQSAKLGRKRWVLYRLCCGARTSSLRSSCVMLSSIFHLKRLPSVMCTLPTAAPAIQRLWSLWIFVLKCSFLLVATKWCSALHLAARQAVGILG